MADEKEADGLELNPQKPDSGEGDELDTIVEAVGSKPDSKSNAGGDKPKEEEDEKGDDKGDDPNKDKKPEVDENGKEIYHKVGDQVFYSKEEFIKWANKQHGELSNVAGENARLKKQLEEGKNKVSDDKKVDEKASEKVDASKLRMQIKVEDFFEANPEANDYRQEMAAFLRAGKANDKNGKPDLAIAYQKALRADGKDAVVEGESDENALINQRRIIRAGARESGNGETFQDKGEMDKQDDFADRAVTGAV